MIGIYKITSPSGRIYIGQSINLNKRIKRYKRLCSSIESQPKLWSSFLKYGSKKHIYDILEKCDTNSLNNRERYWQDFYNVIKKGLNCVLTKSSDKHHVISKETRLKLSRINSGKKLSIVTKRKMRKAALGKVMSTKARIKMSIAKKGKTSNMKGVLGKNNPNSIPISQFTLDGILIKNWYSAADVNRKFGYSAGHICECCKGKRKQAYSFLWKYKDIKIK